MSDHELSDGNSLAETIERTARDYRLAQIYFTFVELEIGDSLSISPLSIEELAERTGVDPQALARFVDAAIALGLIAHNESGQVHLTDVAREVLTSSGTRSMVHSLRLERAFYERWGRLAQAIRLGTRPAENRDQESHPEWVRTFTLALFERSRHAARLVARAIHEALPEPGTRPLRLVDVGGGHGAYSLAIADLRPDVEATVFDLPEVIEVTREIIAASGLADRVNSVAGDFHSDPIGERFDAALLFGVLHGETPRGAERLLQNILRSLRSGGLVMIRSRGIEKSLAAEGERELFDLHMLLSTDGGKVARSIEVREQVQSAGFAFHGEYPVKDRDGESILVFRKPG